MRDVEVLMQHRTIDEIELLLGQGDFAFLAAKGTHEGKPCVYIDLYRVENEKVVEHWGFPEMTNRVKTQSLASQARHRRSLGSQMSPPPAEWKNSNGML